MDIDPKEAGPQMELPPQIGGVPDSKLLQSKCPVATSFQCKLLEGHQTASWSPPTDTQLPSGALLSFVCPTAASFGVSAQIGSGVVQGGPEIRFHQGSTRVLPGFHEGSTRVPPGFLQGSTRFCKGCGAVRALKRVPHVVGDIT